jgi:hypothetical protein
MASLKRNLTYNLSIGIFLYLLFASLDVYLTLKGTRGDISLEGNPMIRYMMVAFGLMPGLIIEKTLVLLISLAVLVVALMGIEKEADWVYYLALTRVTRDWMRRKKRYWVTFIPVYFVALSQGLAAISWIVLISGSSPT